MFKEPTKWSAFGEGGTIFSFWGVLFVGNYYLPIYSQALGDASLLMSSVHALPTSQSLNLLSMIPGVMGKSL